MKKKNLKEASINELSNELALRLESIDLNTLSVATSLSASITYDIVKKVLYSIFSISENKELKVGDIVKTESSPSTIGLLVEVSDSHAEIRTIGFTVGFSVTFQGSSDISLCTDDEAEHFRLRLKEKGYMISEDGLSIVKIKEQPKVGDVVYVKCFEGIICDIKNKSAKISIDKNKFIFEYIDNLKTLSKEDKKAFKDDLRANNLMIGKDGVSIIRWMPKYGEIFWFITDKDNNGSGLCAEESERWNTEEPDSYYDKSFFSKELAQQAIDNL